MTSNERGFTLIELMIAITLGTLLIYTATAAFRVAAQSVTIANRLSLENAVLRAGYQIALRDLDFWTNVDDPHDPGRQGLRSGSSGRGMPFTAFTTSWPGAIGETEAANGHDHRDVAWSMGNPRMWWRGQMAEKSNTDLRFGRYGLFANNRATLNTNQFSSVTVLIGTGSVSSSYGGPVSIPHSWLYNQISGLEKALGFYGLCDYLPSNAVYAWYEPYSVGTNLGGLPNWLVRPEWPFNNGDGNQLTPRGKYRNSYQTSYGIIDPRSTNNPNELLNRHRRWYHLGYGSGEGSQNEFNSWSAIPENHLPARPLNWPGLQVSVQRFIKNTRFVNLARVTWTNSITGQTSELSFSSFSTTLRGARQQRLPGGGWAKWDNDGSANDPTLDNY